jgi:hypothetical protein
MDPDAQPDRGQRCALQLQRARHRIGRASERRHKAVALALLDRAHTIVCGDDVRHRLIQTSDRGGHLAGLGLPQPRGTLHVSQQQRHRARRQKPAHANFAPVHQRHVRTRIDLAHASQHAATTRPKASAETRRAADFLRGFLPGQLRLVPFFRSVSGSVAPASAPPASSGCHRATDHAQLRISRLRASAMRAGCQANFRPLPPWSWHGLAPRDMPLQVKRSRPVAVAIPQVRISRGITARPRQ